MAMLLLAIAPGAARADCCTDFFGCAAAIATLGASCVAEELTSEAANAALRPTIDKLKTMIADGRRDLDDGAQNRQKIADEARGEVGDEMAAARELSDKAVDRAEFALWSLTSPKAKGAIATPAGGRPGAIAAPPVASNPVSAPSVTSAGTGAVVPRGGAAVSGTAIGDRFDPPAEPERVRRVLEYSVGEVKKDKGDIGGVISKNDALRKQLSADASAESRDIRNQYENTVAREIEAQIAKMEDFIRHPLDPTRLPALVDGVARALIMISNKQGADLEARAKAADEALARRIEQVRNAGQDSGGMAQHADGVAGAMEQVAESPTTRNVDKLEKLADMPRYAAGSKAMSVERALWDRTSRHVDEIRQVARRIETDIAARPTAGADLAPAVLTSYRSRVDSDLARMFAGKNGPAASAELESLRAEANRRYAADTRTRDAVLRLLDERTARYRMGASTATTPGFPGARGLASPAAASPAGAMGGRAAGTPALPRLPSVPPPPNTQPAAAGVPAAQQPAGASMPMQQAPAASLPAVQAPGTVNAGQVQQQIQQAVPAASH